jgi:hypothetical protein
LEFCNAKQVCIYVMGSIIDIISKERNYSREKRARELE